GIWEVVERHECFRSLIHRLDGLRPHQRRGQRGVCARGVDERANVQLFEVIASRRFRRGLDRTRSEQATDERDARHRLKEIATVWHVTPSLKDVGQTDSLPLRSKTTACEIQ